MDRIKQTWNKLGKAQEANLPAKESRIKKELEVLQKEEDYWWQKAKRN